MDETRKEGIEAIAKEAAKELPDSLKETAVEFFIKGCQAWSSTPTKSELLEEAEKEAENLYPEFHKGYSMFKESNKIRRKQQKAYIKGRMKSLTN